MNQREFTMLDGEHQIANVDRARTREPGGRVQSLPVFANPGIAGFAVYDRFQYQNATMITIVDY